MFEKLQSIEQTYDDLTRQMTDPAVISDQSVYTKVTRQHRELEPLVEKHRALRKLESDIEGAREILRETTDEEMRQMAELELTELEEKRESVESDLKLLLLPSDPERREERHPRSARRYGRRRGLSLCS